MMKYKTQWRVPGLLNLHKHETEDRKRGDAGIKQGQVTHRMLVSLY